MLMIEPLPAIEAQRLFCERFAAIEVEREMVS
jgi:hypothetical protein